MFIRAQVSGPVPQPWPKSSFQCGSDFFLLVPKREATGFFSMPQKWSDAEVGFGNRVQRTRAQGLELLDLAFNSSFIHQLCL